MLTACQPSPPEVPQAPVVDGPLMASRAVRLNPENAGFSPAPVLPEIILDPLILKDLGFGQVEDQIGFGFLVENPNPDHAVRHTKYDITAYDEDGVVTGTSTSYIAALQPNQTVGIGDRLRVEEGKTVARLDVHLTDGYPDDPLPPQAIEVRDLAYTQGAPFSILSAILTNPTQENFTTLRVSALLYDRAGAIIGGGFTYLNFINADSSAGVRILVTASDDVADFAIFPHFSASTLLHTQPDQPGDAAEVKLEQTGFGQLGRRVGFAFILANPNGQYSVENAEYNLTAYSSEDFVLGVDSGTIHRLNPNQTLGVGGNFIISEGDTIDRIEVHIRPGTFVPSAAIPAFSADNIDFTQSRYASTVSGNIHNPFSQDITNLRVSALLYDATGAIIGGGYSFLDTASAGAQTPVEVFVYSDQEPAHIELHAATTILSETGE